MYYDTVYSEGHNWAYGDFESDTERDALLRQATTHWLGRLNIQPDANIMVLELGCGNGALRPVHPKWTGLEFSFEHVPDPGRVFFEIQRVLKPGGTALIAPAWHCRAWVVKRLPFRRYRDLSVWDFVQKATIPIRRTLLWRGLAELPSRLAREWAIARRSYVELDFLPLHPDMNPDLPHETDDDAFACIDPHAAIAYFLTRGWRVISHETFRARMTCRSEPVVVQRPQTTR
jgi:hypothetical protein